MTTTIPPTTLLRRAAAMHQFSDRYGGPRRQQLLDRTVESCQRAADLARQLGDDRLAQWAEACGGVVDRPEGQGVES